LKKYEKKFRQTVYVWEYAEILIANKLPKLLKTLYFEDVFLTMTSIEGRNVRVNTMDSTILAVLFVIKKKIMMIHIER